MITETTHNIVTCLWSHMLNAHGYLNILLMFLNDDDDYYSCEL